MTTHEENFIRVLALTALAAKPEEPSVVKAAEYFLGRQWVEELVKGFRDELARRARAARRGGRQSMPSFKRGGAGGLGGSSW